MFVHKYVGVFFNTERITIYLLNLQSVGKLNIPTHITPIPFGILGYTPEEEVLYPHVVGSVVQQPVVLNPSSLSVYIPGLVFHGIPVEVGITCEKWALLQEI
jgi:hypothetical protein